MSRLSKPASVGQFIPETAIGADTFRELVEQSTVFVDKSRLIHEYLSNSTKVTLITYPRRWGKTINLDMIRTFLELEADSSGAELVESKKQNKKLFAGGMLDDNGKVAPLAIWQDKDFVDKHCGRYPLILVSFKDARGGSHTEIVDKITSQLSKLYSKHGYLLNSDELQASEQKTVRDYIDRKINMVQLKEGLETLSRYLYKHFKREVIILVDEYDSPINHANLRFNNDEGQLVVDLFRDIFSSALKGNKYLYKGLVTGILRIAKADLFSGINNFREYGITTRRYSSHYGFTKEEVERLFKAYRVPVPMRQEIKQWYNGYIVAGLEIYNPWSILSCLDIFKDTIGVKGLDVKKEVLLNYWEESGNVDFLSDLFHVPRIKEIADRLIEGGNFYFNLRTQITARDFNALKEMVNSGASCEINTDKLNLLMSYLFLAGYLTPASSEYNKHFRLPNKEVRYNMQLKMLGYYDTVYNIGIKYFDAVTSKVQKLLNCTDQAKIAGIMQEFTDSSKELVAQFPQFKKMDEQEIASSKAGDGGSLAIHANESVIHSIFTYIVLQVKTASVLASEFYMGKGRADLVVVNQKSGRAAVLEFKYNAPEGAATAQIKEREYARELTRNFTVYAIGVNVLDQHRLQVEYEAVKN